jgi:hypothetical protein
MAFPTLVSARKHRTAADFYDGEFPGCFHAYATPYCHPTGDHVHCYIRIRGLGRPWEECPARDVARELLEQAFPVLTASWMRFDIGFQGSLTWHRYLPEVQEGVYDEWRCSAWNLFNEAPDLLRQHGYHIAGMNVEPLPGPWKWKFL